MVGATGAGAVGGIAATVGAKICAPQLRQKASPGAAGVPHCGHIVAFNVGSFIEPPEDVLQHFAVGRCFYRETKPMSMKFYGFCAVAVIPRQR